jgi:hypothetical protein
MSRHGPILDRLARIDHAPSDLVTLTLDVSRTGILPEETRLFLKDRVLKSVEPALAERIREQVGSLSPGSHGFYLVAGPGVWEPLELQVPLPTFLHLGRTPYLPPLVAAIAGAPRALVARFDERTAHLHGVELGVWSDLDRWNAFLIDRDTERLTAGRPIATGVRTGIGGGKRDRFEQTLEAETERMIEELARRIAALDPPSAIFVFSDRERFGLFRNHLPVALRSLAEGLGPAPRDEAALRQAVEARMAGRRADRERAEVREFEERRARNHLVALGPDAVAAHRLTGHLARVFLDPQDPVPGSWCPACEALRKDPPGACPTCPGSTAAVSLSQEIVAHAILHPPLALTFVSDRWLRDHGGMAGLLSLKAVRGRRV